MAYETDERHCLCSMEERWILMNRGSSKWSNVAGALIVSCWLCGCSATGSWIASSGPSKTQITAEGRKSSPSIRVVDIDERAVQRIVAAQRDQLFSTALGDGRAAKYAVGPGDFLEISIWEAPPAMLFGSAPSSGSPVLTNTGAGAVAPRVATVPEQMVAEDGSISVPFAGTMKVVGKSPRQIESAIVGKLAGKANRPQVLVSVTRNVSANVTVVGEVAKSLQMPLTAKGERVLDAIAAAGGLRDQVPVQKATVRLTRGSTVLSMPLERVIKDPAENIQLLSGDVVTTLYQPLSLTVLGAANKNQELTFEAQGITLTQALARSEGLLDNRADARGVFIFRFELPQAVEDKSRSELVTTDGRIPLVYRLDLKNPASFLVAQTFPMRNGDVVYIANAPAAELQKFVTILTDSVFSAANIVHLTN